jgi:hypothetical protein
MQPILICCVHRLKQDVVEATLAITLSCTALTANLSHHNSKQCLKAHFLHHRVLIIKLPMVALLIWTIEFHLPLCSTMCLKIK